MASLQGNLRLAWSHLPGLQAPATGASQRAQTTRSSSLQPLGPPHKNPGFRGLHARAWVGSQAATTAAITTNTGEVSTWWTLTLSGMGWFAWCAAVRWPPWNSAPSRGTSGRSTQTPCCGVLLTRRSSSQGGRAIWVWEVRSYTALLLYLHLRRKRSSWTWSNMQLVGLWKAF